MNLAALLIWLLESYERGVSTWDGLVAWVDGHPRWFFFAALFLLLAWGRAQTRCENLSFALQCAHAREREKVEVDA